MSVMFPVVSSRLSQVSVIARMYVDVDTNKPQSEIEDSCER